MIVAAVRIGIVLGWSFVALSSVHGYSLKTNSMVATFSEDGVLVRLENTLTGEVMQLDSPSQFLIQTDSEEIGDRDCRREAVHRTPKGLEVSYIHPRFEVLVAYRAQPDDHFIEKTIRLRHTGDSGFAIKRFSLGRWSVGGQGTLVPFQHGQCVTYFLRQSQGGHFYGVRTPFQELLPPDTKFLDLAYPVNMVFEKGAVYEAEPAYWGVCRLRGRYAPEAPKLLDECVVSSTPPDIGEVEAMLDMVQKFAPPRGGMTLAYNGWQGGMSYAGYEGEEGTARAKQDIEVLRAVKEMLGPCIVQPAGPFFGAHEQVMRLRAEDDRLPESPGRRLLLDGINANGMTAMHWACLKSVHGWTSPPIGPYCPDRPDWKADAHSNCTANPAYLQWFARLIFHDLERGFAGFVADEPGPGLRHQMHCDKPDHGHLPGNASYAYFVRRRELFREMRKRFGPNFELQGQRPHMDAGIWDMTYLNSVFTFSEDPGRNAEALREWSRLRRHYSFVPSYMDQIMVQAGFEPVDQTMLSILAVSSNYVFISPCSPEKLAEFKSAIGNDHRVFARGWSEFPESDRARVRFWLDWAREHREYMDDVIDLPDWPSSGRPDGYLRVKNGAGFAFLFNTSDAEQTISIPLDGEANLDHRRTYRLEQIHPASGPTTTARSKVLWNLPAKCALLIAIQPLP